MRVTGIIEINGNVLVDCVHVKSPCSNMCDQICKKEPYKRNYKILVILAMYAASCMQFSTTQDHCTKA